MCKQAGSSDRRKLSRADLFRWAGAAVAATAVAGCADGPPAELSLGSMGGHVPDKIDAQDDTEKLIEALTNLAGASSFEAPVRKKIEEFWGKSGVKVTVDNVGNVIASIEANQANEDKKKTVLIMAHMDEVGFIITGIDEKGFMKAKPLGGWIDHVLWGHLWEISVGDRIISAITGMDPPHVLTDFKSSPEVTSAELFFDTGLSRQQLLDMGVRPGLPITPSARFRVLDPGKRYAAKALDDRAMLAMMTELLRELKQRSEAHENLNIVFAATVQEEVGMRGARALEGINPDVILNLEAGIAKDYPTQFTAEVTPELGKGPALFVYDGHMLPSTELLEFTYGVAKRNNIPTQWESEESYGQDASSLQFTSKGVQAINIGLPVRYVHSHWGIMDRRDYDQTLQLIKAVLRDIYKGYP